MNQIREFHQYTQNIGFDYDGTHHNLYMTIGAVKGRAGEGIEHLITAADNLLYVGKNSTKNCIVTNETAKLYEV